MPVKRVIINLILIIVFTSFLDQSVFCQKTVSDSTMIADLKLVNLLDTSNSTVPNADRLVIAKYLTLKNFKPSDYYYDSFKKIFPEEKRTILTLYNILAIRSIYHQAYPDDPEHPSFWVGAPTTNQKDNFYIFYDNFKKEVIGIEYVE